MYTTAVKSLCHTTNKNVTVEFMEVCLYRIYRREGWVTERLHGSSSPLYLYLSLSLQGTYLFSLSLLPPFLSSLTLFSLSYTLMFYFTILLWGLVISCETLTYYQTINETIESKTCILLRFQKVSFFILVRGHSFDFVECLTIG